jgi:hypothetical protein
VVDPYTIGTCLATRQSAQVITTCAHHLASAQQCCSGEGMQQLSIVGGVRPRLITLCTEASSTPQLTII